MISTSSLHFDTILKSAAFRLHMTIFVAAALLGAHYAHADPQCITPKPQEVSRVFHQWRNAVASRNPDELVNFYTDDATLSVGKAGEPIKGKAAIRAYYVGLLARHPQPVVVSSEVAPGCNSAVVTGFILYRVTGARKGTRDLLGGRFTTEFALVDGAWRIAKHTLGGDERKLDQPFESSQL